MEGIRRALVLGLVLFSGTAIEQAPSAGPQYYYSSKKSFSSNELFFALFSVLRSMLGPIGTPDGGVESTEKKNWFGTPR